MGDNCCVSCFKDIFIGVLVVIVILVSLGYYESQSQLEKIRAECNSTVKVNPGLQCYECTSFDNRNMSLLPEFRLPLEMNCSTSPKNSRKCAMGEKCVFLEIHAPGANGTRVVRKCSSTNITVGCKSLESPFKGKFCACDKSLFLTAINSIFCNGINCATPNYTHVNEQIRLMNSDVDGLLAEVEAGLIPKNDETEPDLLSKIMTPLNTFLGNAKGGGKVAFDTAKEKGDALYNKVDDTMNSFVLYCALSAMAPILIITLGFVAWQCFLKKLWDSRTKKSPTATDNVPCQPPVNPFLTSSVCTNVPGNMYPLVPINLYPNISNGPHAASSIKDWNAQCNIK